MDWCNFMCVKSPNGMRGDSLSYLACYILYVQYNEVFVLHAISIGIRLATIYWQTGPATGKRRKKMVEILNELTYGFLLLVLISE